MRILIYTMWQVMKLPICRCGIQIWSALGSLAGCNQSKNLVKLPQILKALFLLEFIVLLWPSQLRRQTLKFYPRGRGFKSHQTQSLFCPFLIFGGQKTILTLCILQQRTFQINKDFLSKLCDFNPLWFVTFINFFSSRYSNLPTIEILVLSSWIPASKEFCYLKVEFQF